MPAFLNGSTLSLARHVERLAELDVELLVRPDRADAGGVIVGFVGAGDQLAVLDHIADRDVGALVEEFGCRELPHAVALGDVEEPVLGKTDAVRDDEVERGCEALHLVGGPVLVAIGDRPDGILARADEGDHALRPDGHVPGVGDDRVEIDLEARRQLDLLQVLAQLVGIGAGLRHELNAAMAVPVACIFCSFDWLFSARAAPPTHRIAAMAAEHIHRCRIPCLPLLADLGIQISFSVMPR